MDVYHHVGITLGAMYQQYDTEQIHMNEKKAAYGSIPLCSMLFALCFALSFTTLL